MGRSNKLKVAPEVGDRIALIDKLEANYEVDPKTGCWLWTLRTDRNGYGHLRWRGGKRLAHRLALAACLGRELRPVECACHKCDARACINPDHLFIGSHAENMADMVRKGRQARGEEHAATLRRTAARGDQHGAAKLTEAQVHEIRAAYASGAVLQSDLASAYGVSQPIISYIVRRKTWTHI